LRDLASAFDELELSNDFAQAASTHISKRQFESVSKTGQCLCGAVLTQEKIEELGTQVSEHSHTQREAQELVDDIRDLFESDYSFDDYKNSVSSLLSSVVDAENRLASLEAQRAAITSTLNPSDATRATELVKLRGELDVVSNALVNAKLTLDESREAYAKVTKKLSLEEDRRTGVELLRKQHSWLNVLEKEITTRLFEQREAFMSELRQEVTSILLSLIAQNVDVEVSDNLTIKIFEPGSRVPLGLAGGQKKALPISMAISLQRIARRRAHQAREHNSQLTDEYPLVIDSAFGELGGDLRSKVVAELIKEAGQTFLLVSDSQAAGVVDSIPPAALCRELLLHAWSARPGVDVRTPPLHGREVTWQSFGAKVNQTTVEEVE